MSDQESGRHGRPVNQAASAAGRNAAVASCSLRSHAPACRSALRR
jgi:hypothetical protein